MAKRGENIYLRKDGRYEGRYIKGRTNNGKPVFGSVYGVKYGECKEKLIQMKLLHSVKALSVKTCGTGTIAEFLTYWLFSIVQPCIKSSTFANYASIIDKWLVPSFGKTKLIKLGREEVQRFVNLLSELGLSSGTIRNIYRVLFSAMKKAVEYGYLLVNPCEGIHLPEMVKKEAPLFNIQEQKVVEEAANADKNGFPIMLAMYTGLRVGEICALKWSDVDMENGLLQVSGTRQRIKDFTANAKAKTRLVDGSTKSHQSMRVIPLPKYILNRLKALSEIATGDYVFMCKGHPLEPRILQYRFKRLLEKAGLKPVNFHALRHTFATRCMELNFDIKTLSELLGHSSAKLTLDKYGHSQIEHKRAVMESLNQLYAQTA